jgi:hypothetical protein
MELMELDMRTVVRPVLPEKACAPRLVTESDRVTTLNAVQLKNALFPMDVAAITIEAREVHR